MFVISFLDMSAIFLYSFSLIFWTMQMKTIYVAGSKLLVEGKFWGIPQRKVKLNYIMIKFFPQ